MAEFNSHEAPARDAKALPVMIPPKLFGRDAQLPQVYAPIKENKTVQINGAAGVGKSAFAAALSLGYMQQGGAVLWLNTHDDPLASLLARVGRAYNIAEVARSDNPTEAVGRVADRLKEAKPLIVLDGVLSYGVASAFVNRVSADLPTLILNREQLPDSNWTAVEIQPLAESAAVNLLKFASGNADAPEADFAKLANLLGNQPYALSVIGGSIRASKKPPADYLTALAEAGSGVDPRLLAITAAFRLLGSALQGIVLMMGATFSRHASAELLSMISGAPEATVQQVMNALSASFMSQRTFRYGQPYYGLHNVTYEFAQSRLKTSNRLEELQNKVRDAVLDYAKKYGASGDLDYDKLAMEMESFLAVAAWAAANGDTDTARQLLSVLSQADEFVRERGFVYELLQLQRLGTSDFKPFPAYAPDESEAFAISDDEDFDDEDDDDFDDDEDFDDEDYDDFDDDEDFDDEDEAESTLAPPPPLPKIIPDDDDEDDEDEVDILSSIEDEETAPGDVDVLATDDIAQLRAALGEARQNDNTDRQGAVLRRIGEIQVEQGMDNEAIATYSEALELYEEVEDKQGTLDMLDTLSALMAKTENSQPAVLNATRGIKLAEELDDIETQMHLLTTLGDAHQQLGETSQAVNAYSQALELARNADDSQNEAIVLYKLGYAQLDDSEIDHAIQTLEQALSLFKKQLKRDYEGRVLGGLGTAYSEAERWTEAMSFYTSALYIAREVGDKEEEALHLGNLAYAAVQAGTLGDAVLRYRQALHLAYEKNDKEDIVSNLVELARLLMRSPKHLTIAELLVQEALRYEPNDRDANTVNESIEIEKRQATNAGIEMLDVGGTAREYAELAYQLLDE